MTEDGGSAGAGDGPVEVYWRPGCGYCGRLFRSLERAGVTVRLHNIWDDDEARSFVRSHNRGNETVPTVVIGDEVYTNPAPDAVIAQVRAQFPELVGEPDTGAGWRARLHR